MIQWVAELSSKAVNQKNVFIGTEDKKIYNVVTQMGFKAIMTSNKCLTGTDRLAEIAKKIKADIYINVQGDEPLINPKDIQKVIKAKKKYPNDVINAYTVIKKNEDPNSYGKIFDTISVCLSKGLGTPLGTILLGSNELMSRAIRIRKILGGAMRQVGFMAAAGLYALDNHFERLAEDHQKASEIAQTLQKLDYIKKVEPADTNIVIFNLIDEMSKDQFMNDMFENHIQISDMGQGKLRMVTHLDYTDEMHHIVLNVLKNYEY